ncbi:class I SAM-dependent methyltransferase [Chloroflexota bacterium]
MFDIERFLEEKLNPVFRAHYALWVYWWPLWRNFSGRSILRKWEDCNLIQEGQTFLDYGCGTGDFTIPAAKKVNHQGKVYALDYFERQLDIVKNRSEKAGLTNVETILSSSETGLPDESVDIVWMCDVLHEIKERRAALEEVYRVLKRDGILAIHDGMGERSLEFTAGLFSPVEIDKKFLRFTKIN